MHVHALFRVAGNLVEVPRVADDRLQAHAVKWQLVLSRRYLHDSR